ncbi:hypothetical protein EYF80_032899 [Liparis tanakae]|uniref:Uncharacterized protein n=1 Tax=Liparis tanakae TaxID=230148 RepID=A0A4Z2GU08_9TELE|nr:hypothetical protein EYF80_032899 [Liparis tanakae]
MMGAGSWLLLLLLACLEKLQEISGAAAFFVGTQTAAEQNAISIFSSVAASRRQAVSNLQVLHNKHLSGDGLLRCRSSSRLALWIHLVLKPHLRGKALACLTGVWEGELWGVELQAGEKDTHYTSLCLRVHSNGA